MKMEKINSIAQYKGNLRHMKSNTKEISVRKKRVSKSLIIIEPRAHHRPDASCGKSREIAASAPLFEPKVVKLVNEPE